MALGYMGSTTIDVAASIAVVMFLAALTVALMAPGWQLRRVNDTSRTEDVRNIMEALLEMQTVDPESVDKLRSAVESAGAPPRVMFGTAESCVGDWGTQCGDAILADTCLDGEAFGLGEYLETFPIDLGHASFSQKHSGYYVTFSPGVLEVGACNPQLQEIIHLERTFF